MEVKDYNRIITMLFNQLHMAWDVIEESRGLGGCTFEECLEDCLFMLDENQKEILKGVLGK